MGWRWIEPGLTRRVGPMEATRAAAEDGAVSHARGGRPVEDEAQCVLLWRSLERAGWRIEEVDR
jgi:hypothetical protein